MKIKDIFKNLFMKTETKKTSKMVINNKSFVGNSITITDEGVFVDGEKVEGSNVPKIEVHIYGDVKKAETVSGNIIVNGSCGYVQTTSGDVETTGDVSGSIKTVSGDVKCGIVVGNISTVSGDVKNKK